MDISITRTTKADYIYFKEWLNDPENTRWLGSIYHVNEYTEIFHMMSLNKRENLFFTLRSKGTPIGLFNVSLIDHVDKSGMIWYIMGDKNYRGKGYSDKAVNMALDILFTEYDFHSLNAWVLEQNDASINILERNNFKRVGIQRESHMQEGKFVNRVLFDLLKTDFRRWDDD